MRAMGFIILKTILEELMFKKLQELLEAGKIDNDVAETLDSEIGVALKEKNDEAAKWRIKYQELNKSYEEVLGSKTELESQLQSLDERIQKAKEDGKSELAKELEAERAQKEELAKKLGELEKTTRDLKIENELSKALSSFEYEPVDIELVGEYLKGRHVDLLDDGVKFKDGDTVLDLNDGLKRLAEQRPNLFKAKGVAGSGNENGSNGGGIKKRSQLSDEEADAYIQEHGQEAYMKLPE